MVELISKGGILVVPILICSVVALAVFMERVLRFSRLRTREHDLAEQVAGFLAQERQEEAEKMVRHNDSPMGRLMGQAMEVRNRSRDTLETIIAHAIDDEVRQLSASLQILATIGNIAPLIGLLGTVVGMIKAFMVIQQMGGKVNAAVLAGGIWEAMLTTAVGLAVALPTMLAHSYLTARVDTCEAGLRKGAVMFLKAVTRDEAS
ncbi:MAG: MotA/TolQ/ExbB proton channel family protein [Desulfobacterales bacterium]|nr:MotA/TolQ/ExbB proton channel family protein [Desulfobacterales bacterium]